MVSMQKVTVLLIFFFILIHFGDSNEDLDVVSIFLEKFQNVRHAVLFLCDIKTGKELVFTIECF